MMGDGATCIAQPQPPVTDGVPADVRAGNCLPVAVNGAPATGTINGGPLVYCLTPRAGTT